MSVALPTIGETVTSTFDHIGFLPLDLREELRGLPLGSVTHVGFVSLSGSELTVDQEYMTYKRWHGYEMPDVSTLKTSESIAHYILDDARQEFDTKGLLGLVVEMGSVLQPADSTPEPDYEQQTHVDLLPQPDPGTLLYLVASNSGTILLDGDYQYLGDQYKYHKDLRVQALPQRQAEDWEVVRGQMSRSLHGRPQFDQITWRPFVRSMVERR